MVYGDRLMRLLAEEALCRLPSIEEGEVETPCGVSKGFVEKRKMDICLVSVVRSGIQSYHFVQLITYLFDRIDYRVMLVLFQLLSQETYYKRL